MKLPSSASFSAITSYIAMEMNFINRNSVQIYMHCLSISSVASKGTLSCLPYIIHLNIDGLFTLFSTFTLFSILHLYNIVPGVHLVHHILPRQAAVGPGPSSLCSNILAPERVCVCVWGRGGQPGSGARSTICPPLARCHKDRSILATWKSQRQGATDGATYYCEPSLKNSTMERRRERGRQIYGISDI